jgi:RNA 3'-terminal phosphate cyclase (ATP)
VILLKIDGTLGEGGGQILRSSLSLSLVTGKAFRIENVRAGREKPGLLRQHLTAALGAAEVCGAETEGATLGSTCLTFRPAKLVPENTGLPWAPRGVARSCFRPCCRH